MLPTYLIGLPDLYKSSVDDKKKEKFTFTFRNKIVLSSLWVGSSLTQGLFKNNMQATGFIPPKDWVTNDR